jgi:hypothetical protein
MTEQIDNKLTDEFLGYVLDRYKDGTKGRNSAIGLIAHVLCMPNLPKDIPSNPNRYMRAVLAQQE